ncbi:MAG: hypothetical protein CK549_04630 [Cyanobium sp. Baikal-G2]|nr:MAG: hypothetical protein CK549_04630 [Cyanobium sp. Baikal-G2]
MISLISAIGVRFNLGLGVASSRIQLTAEAPISVQAHLFGLDSMAIHNAARRMRNFYAFDAQP